MIRLLRFLTLVLAFTVDVQLSAEAVFLPEYCWGESDPCAVENRSLHPLKLTLKNGNLNLDSQTVIQTIADDAADIARGTLLASHSGKFRWHTPFGDVLCQACEVILQRTDKSLEIHSLKGEVSVQRKGDDEKYNLPAGFSVRLSSVTIDGRADLDFPQASPFRPVAKIWAKVFPGSPIEFKKQLESYHDIWERAADTSSVMMTEEANRRIASADAERNKEQQAIQAKEKEDRRLRDLFRNKNNL